MNNLRIPSVTVLTTVYNGLPHLEEAIDSTLNQTYSNFKYLIIDDASPDKDVVPFIQQYKDDRIHLIVNEKNLGVSKTFNKALGIIDTEFLIRLDQDDISLPNRIEELMGFFQANTKVSVACSWEHTIDSEGKRIRDWTREISNYGDFISPVLLGICPIWHPSIAFRTESLKEAGGFDHSYIRAEDFEVTARLAMKRYEAGICRKFLVLQREHDNRQSIQFDSIQTETTSRIQKECIEQFLPNDGSDLISRFLLLKVDIGFFDKHKVIEISKQLNNMKSNMKKELNLSSSELISIEKNFTRRIGYGLKFLNYYRFLPSIFFIMIFYLLSPTHIKNLRLTVSATLNFLMELKYKLKEYK
tara:strand:- start:12336 stop:13409 length:1074 start_codon:yes stop_codon:yes gene_type:complete